MQQYLVSFSKIWDDTDFFEVHMEWKALDINVSHEFYTNQYSIGDLSDKLLAVSRFEKDRIEWTEGNNDTKSHTYVHFEVSKYKPQGQILFSVIIDNNRVAPHNKRCEFSNIVEAGSLEVFARRLKKLYSNEDVEIEGIYSIHT